MNTKRINMLLLFFFNILLFSLMAYSEEKYFYQTDFNNGRDGHPNGWNREGSGIWDEYGRSGKGLKISTWTENGRTSRWRSQLIKVEPGIYNIGVWAAQNIIYSQDPYYCAILAAVFYDNDKKEISKRNVVQMAVPPPRSRYEGALIIPEGLCWQYYSGIFTVPAGGQYLELVFAWSDFTEPYRTAALINGEVRIDDLSLVMGTLPDNPPPVIQSTEELPFLVSLSAPVDLNLFSVADPLEFTIFLYASNKKPLPTMDGLEINYQVSDYRRLELELGKTSARFEPYRYQERDKEPIDGWLATFILTDRQKVFEGRWLALEVAVECKGEQLGKGDIAFAVFRQDSGQEDDPRQFHFLRGTGGDKYLEWRASLSAGNVKSVIPTVWNKPHPTWNQLIGNKGLLILGCDTNWGKRQTGKDQPVDFIRDPAMPEMHMAMNHILTYGERLPGYMYMSYLETKNVPKWAEKISPDGKHDIDQEAYVKYFSEFVKHNPCTYFFVNSTEGSSVYDYPDLTVKVAKAVKAIDPRLKIGAVANVSGGVEAVRKIRKDVLEAIDIFVDDIYNTKVDVLPFKRELERLGYKNKEIWLPEHGDLASRDQVSRAAVMVRNVTFALANGLDKLLWWSDPAPSYIMLDKNYQYTFGPDLRGSADYLIDKNFFAGWRTKGGGPRIAPARKHSEQAWSPFLEAVSLHHLMKHLGYVYDGRTLDIGCDITGLLYKNKLFPGKSGKEISILALSRIPGSGAIHKIMKVDSPYHLTDIYGQGKALNPKEGISLVTITEEPLLGAFNELQSKIQFAESPVKITLPQAIFPGSTVELKVILNNPFSVTCDEELKVFIDPRWAITPETQQVKLAVGAKGEYTFQIKAPQKIFAAQYPIFLRFSTSEGKIWGELEEKITVTDNLTMTMEAKPGRPGEKPDVQITLKNNSTRAEMAQVSLLTSLTTQLRPEKLVKSCELPAGKTGIVNFNLNRSPEVNSPYDLECSVSASGQTIKSAEKLFFIGVPKRKMPIKIDGDLGDWSANNPAILPFFCSYRIPDREASKNYHPDDPKNDWKGKQDSSAVFYMCWDENRIYWAMRITDDIKYNDGEYSQIWPYDCLHLCIYPWKYNRGDKIKGSAYKDHIGIDKHGKSIIDRVQSPVDSHPNTQGWWPEGAEFCAVKTSEGYIFEGSYSRNALAPLKFETGSRFSLAATYIDYDDASCRKGQKGILLFFGTGNVEGKIEEFGQLILVE